MISGSADFAQISGLSLTRAAAKGQRLLAIANTLERPITEISIRKDVATAANFDAKAPLEQRAQILKGHSFAIGGVNTVVHAYLRIVALAGGLDPESIRVAPMAGDNMLAAMQTRQIDGISTVLPWTRKGVVDGSARAGRERRRRRPAAPHAARLQRGRGEARDLRKAEIDVPEDGARHRRGHGNTCAPTPPARWRS